MKIALSHYSVKSDISGVTSWLIAFSKRLVQAGHQVAILLHHFGVNPYAGSITNILRQIGVDVYAYRRTGSLELDIRQSLAFLRNVQPNLFLPQCVHAHYLAAAFAGLQGLPWIFTMHSDDPEYWCVAEALPAESYGGITVCVSHFLGQQLRKHTLIETPHVIPYGVTLPTAKARFSDRPFRVVYSGRMVEHQKCISQVLLSLIEACKATPRIEAHVIGDGPDRLVCEQLVYQAGLAERIVFHGRLPPEQVLPLLKQSQAILLMSDFEGLPLALLEAMAFGVVPVVRMIPSGIPELVFHECTGIIVRNEPVSASMALIRLSSDPMLWEKCSKNARLLVNNTFNADLCFEKWLDLIEPFGKHPLPSLSYRDIDLCRFPPLSDSRFQIQYIANPGSSFLKTLSLIIYALQCIAYDMTLPLRKNVLQSGSRVTLLKALNSKRFCKT